MRLHKSRIRLWLAAGAAAFVICALATAAQAGFGGFRMIGSHGSMISRGPVKGGGWQRFKGTPKKFNARSLNGTNTAEVPGRHPRHTKHPHPIGPIIGTGVAVGALDPAIAGPSQRQNFSGPSIRRGGIDSPPASERRLVENEVLLEFAGNAQGVAPLLARHGLTQLEAQRFALTGSTFVRARIVARRSVRATLARLGNETILRTGQPNYIYATSQTTGSRPGGTPKPAAGDPAQYALGKLRLNEAHELATGDKILVAVIDSGIDLRHPELQGVIAGSYDALGRPEKPHPHGTGIAGAIAAHAKLMGAAPAARILAIRAFGAHGDGAEATTFAILKGIDHAAIHGARVINMSFAGPADPGLARELSAAHGRGVVLIAASGNLGPTAGPQYPAADRNVIAVSATDADDRMFKASSIDSHIAVAAPGVDILLPAPNNDYQVTSGTSFSAAYVSGVAALVLQRAPGLKPQALRKILEATAKDLGPRGKDSEYGAGLVDAYRAIMTVQSNAAAGPADTAVKTIR
jgi:subtilisin family serine protease